MKVTWQTASPLLEEKAACILMNSAIPCWYSPRTVFLSDFHTVPPGCELSPSSFSLAVLVNYYIYPGNSFRSERLREKFRDFDISAWFIQFHNVRVFEFTWFIRQLFEVHSSQCNDGVTTINLATVFAMTARRLEDTIEKCIRNIVWS